MPARVCPQGELEAELERLEAEGKSHGGEASAGAPEVLQDLRARLSAAEGSQAELVAKRDAKKREERSLNETLEELKGSIAAEHSRQQDEVRSRRVGGG